MSVLEKKLTEKGCKRGIKAINKSLTKKNKGIVVLASDITPFDLISHIPALCDETKTPLFYIKSRFDIRTDSNKPVTCLFIPSEIISNEEISSLLK